MDLYDRSDFANEAEADLFVSIHSNASATNTDFQGIFTYHHPSSNRGARLAQTIQTPLAQITGGIDRGILSNDYVVLRETDMCAALVEMGFMSNHEELMRLIDDSYQDKLAQGIAEGIVRYFKSMAYPHRHSACLRTGAGLKKHHPMDGAQAVDKIASLRPVSAFCRNRRLRAGS